MTAQAQSCCSCFPPDCCVSQPSNALILLFFQAFYKQISWKAETVQQVNTIRGKRQALMGVQSPWRVALQLSADQTAVYHWGQGAREEASVLSSVFCCRFWTEPPHDRAGVRLGNQEGVRVSVLTGHSAFTICTENWFWLSPLWNCLRGRLSGRAASCDLCCCWGWGSPPGGRVRGHLSKQDRLWGVSGTKAMASRVTVQCYKTWHTGRHRERCHALCLCPCQPVSSGRNSLSELAMVFTDNVWNSQALRWISTHLKTLVRDSAGPLWLGREMLCWWLDREVGGGMGQQPGSGLESSVSTQPTPHSTGWEQLILQSVSDKGKGKRI